MSWSLLLHVHQGTVFGLCGRYYLLVVSVKNNQEVGDQGPSVARAAATASTGAVRRDSIAFCAFFRSFGATHSSAPYRPCMLIASSAVMLIFPPASAPTMAASSPARSSPCSRNTLFGPVT